MALVGGSTFTKAAFRIGLHAMNLLNKEQVPGKMLKTADEANAWLGELRAAEQGRSAPS